MTARAPPVESTVISAALTGSQDRAPKRQRGCSFMVSSRAARLIRHQCVYRHYSASRDLGLEIVARTRSTGALMIHRMTRLRMQSLSWLC